MSWIQNFGTYTSAIDNYIFENINLNGVNVVGQVGWSGMDQIFIIIIIITIIF